MKKLLFSRRISGWPYAFWRASLVFALSFFVLPMAAATESDPVPMTQLADVSFRHIEVLSQDGNVSGFTFDLVNGQGSQAGVRYGVQLMRQKAAGQWILEDEQVSPEELHLLGNSERPIEIAYQAPGYLKGDYHVSLVARNTSGLPLATARVGEIVLAGTGQYIEILLDTCFLQIEGDSEAARYLPRAGVDISQNEDLTVRCQVVNHFDQAVTVTSQFQTFYRSTFGREVETSGQSMSQGSESIVLSPEVKKELTVMIPKAQAPQAYDAKFSLAQDGLSVSNAVVLHYVIQGESATIQSVGADKNTYAPGETAHITFAWSGQADAFMGSRVGANTAQALTVSATLASQGVSCGEITLPLDMAVATQALAIPIQSECPTPLLTVMLKNASGTLLDSREIILTPEETLEGAGNAENQSAMVEVVKKPYWLATLLLLLPLLILWYLVRKAKADASNQLSGKNQKKVRRVLSWLFLLPLCASMFMAGGSEVAAATYTLKGAKGEVAFEAYLDKDNYLPGEEIEVTAGYGSELSCINGVNKISLRVGVNGTGWKTIFQNENSVFEPHRAVSLAAPTSVARHYVRVEVSFGDTDGRFYSGFFDLPFNVVATSVNNPPTPPLILSATGGPAPATGMRNISYMFQVISQDPERDQIRYGFDWNNDSQVDEWRPSSGFVASGMPQFSSRKWPAIGTYTFKVLAADKKGASSAWSSHTIQISNTAQYTLTVSPHPQHGRVISSDGLIECGTRCEQAYPAGSDITLQADPNVGYQFQEFTGACYLHGGQTGRCELNMDGDKTMSALFQSTGSGTDGVCGSVATDGACSQTLSGSSSGLCAAGSVGSFRSQGGGWSWQCTGTNGGATVSCAENQCTTSGGGGDWKEVSP